MVTRKSRDDTVPLRRRSPRGSLEQAVELRAVSGDRSEMAGADAQRFGVSLGNARQRLNIGGDDLAAFSSSLQTVPRRGPGNPPPDRVRIWDRHSGKTTVSTAPVRSSSVKTAIRSPFLVRRVRKSVTMPATLHSTLLPSLISSASFSC